MFFFVWFTLRSKRIEKKLGRKLGTGRYMRGRLTFLHTIFEIQGYFYHTQNININILKGEINVFITTHLFSMSLVFFLKLHSLVVFLRFHV